MKFLMSILESSSKMLALLAVVVALVAGAWWWHVHEQQVADQKRQACETQNTINDLAAARAGYQYGVREHQNCG